MTRNAAQSLEMFVQVVLLGLAACLVAPAAGQEWEMTPQQFDSWVCQTGGTPEDRVKSELERQIKSLELATRLTPAQRQKLELAGSIDLGRFLDRVAALRTKYVGQKFDQQQIGQVYQEIQPLQQELQRGLVGRGSLFEKVKRTALESKQRTQLDRAEYSRASTRYHTALRQFLVALDHTLALTESQRQDLLKLLVEETSPPSQFGQYDTYYILSQAAKINESKLENILDAAQMKQFQQGQRQGRAYDNFLQQQGIAPLEKPADWPAAGSSEEAANAP